MHAFEIVTCLRLTDAINHEIARLDTRIGQQLASIPGVTPACPACGLIGGGHAPGCASTDTAVLGLVERLDEITGVGARNAQIIIAELSTAMSVFPPRARRRMGPADPGAPSNPAPPPGPAAPARATRTCAARSASA